MKTLPVVVIYLGDPIRASELVAQLEADNCHAILAAGSDALYEVLNCERVDLVVIENQLRGFLTGLEILERLYEDLLRPATVLVAEASQDTQRRAKKLGLSSVLTPQTPCEEIAAAAKEVLKRSALSQLRISPAARRLVRDADGIRPLPQLLVKLAGSLHDGDLSPDELARDISVDSRVTAELLRLANSSALGRAHKTTNLPDAVNFLGVKRTVSLVLSAGLIQAQAGLLGGLPTATRTWYNYRSVLIGSTASAFAGKLEIVSAETAYILGLLQDVGILVMAQAYGDRYIGLLNRVREIPLLRLEHLELEDFEMTHAEVSAALLQKWGLPESLVSIILSHHSSSDDQQSELENAFLRVMRIGEAVANLADQRSAQRFLTLSRLLSHYGSSRSDQCRTALGEGLERMSESSRLFNVPLPDEQELDALLSEINGHARFDESSPEPEPAPPPQRVDTAETRVPTPAPNDASHARGQCVLAIDDDAHVLKQLRYYVQPLGIELLSCDKLEDAQLLAPRADLIFCDVHLGNENGIEILRQLRHEGYQGPALIISGDRSRETIEQAMNAGISGYLIKPFSKSLLIDKLRLHLDLESEEIAPTCPDKALAGV